MSLLLEIRETQENDLVPLAQVYVDAYTHFDVGEKWDNKSALNLLSYWRKRNSKLCFTACLGKKPLGAFFADVKPWWDGNHLVDGEIFVSPDHEKQGIGRELSIAVYEKALKKYNVVSWDTYTFRNAGHPLSWYKSQGFHEISEWVMITGSVKEALGKLRASRGK